jgi:hypothetical protein
MDAELGVGWLVAWPLRLVGASAIFVGIIVFILSITNPAPEGVQPVFGIDGAFFLALVVLAIFVFGGFQFFLANSVRSHARWAYVVTILFGIAASVGRLFLGATPSTPLRTGPAEFLYYASAWVYLVMAILAAVLLIASFIRRTPQERVAR